MINKTAFRGDSNQSDKNCSFSFKKQAAAWLNDKPEESTSTDAAYRPDNVSPFFADFLCG
ncbi:hypothetical protein [Psychromonas sp.]|uniref:hypothetical protein n=1 Tax=Psychromonas sp. TaxID=1884585 RepID=UPI0039E2D65A